MIAHPVPIVHQRDDHDCGPACLDAVLSYAGKRVYPDAVLAASGVTWSHGCDPADMYTVLDMSGLRPCIEEPMTLDELDEAIERGPVLAAIQAYGTGHWVVVVDVSERRVVVMDPASATRSYRWLTRPEFVRRWWDVDRRDRRRDCVGITTVVRPRLSRPVRGVPA